MSIVRFNSGNTSISHGNYFKTSGSHIGVLPQDILREIFMILVKSNNVESLLSLRLVCHHFNEMQHDSLHLRQIYTAHRAVKLGDSPVFAEIMKKTQDGNGDYVLSTAMRIKLVCRVFKTSLLREKLLLASTKEKDAKARKYLEATREDALEALKEDAEGDLWQAAEALSTLGMMAFFEGEEASTIFMRARQARILYTMTENHMSVAYSYDNIGLVLQAQGDFQAATEHYNKALGIKVTCMGEEHMSVADSYHYMGIKLQEQGNLELALKHLVKALAIFKTTCGDAHVNVAKCFRSLAVIYHATGDMEKADHALREAQAIVAKLEGKRGTSLQEVG